MQYGPAVVVTVIVVVEKSQPTVGVSVVFAVRLRVSRTGPNNKHTSVKNMKLNNIVILAGIRFFVNCKYSL